MKKSSIIGLTLGMVTLIAIPVLAKPAGATLNKPVEHHSHRGGTFDTHLGACTTYYTKQGNSLKAVSHTTYAEIRSNSGNLLKGDHDSGLGTSEIPKFTANENPTRTKRVTWYSRN
ncbi:MAG: hypothetical protein ACRC6T_05900 [Sarcina sp.]